MEFVLFFVFHFGLLDERRGRAISSRSSLWNCAIRESEILIYPDS